MYWMDRKTAQSLILLTYKGKVLLMNKSDGPMDTQQHAWTLIEGAASQKEMTEKALIKEVERQMGIKIEKAERVAESYYHAQLTDNDVNNIDRSEGQLLDFFTRRELDNLLLSSPTQQFIQKHGDLI